MLASACSVSLTSEIWSGNAKEDYIFVIGHYVNADWELQKKVIGIRLIEVKHTGENIVEKVGCVIQVFGLLDKIFYVTLDNVLPMLKLWKLCHLCLLVILVLSII
jgi:hypothetical protein